MNPSRPFILRPVATSLLMVAILLAGAVAYEQLPVSALPQVDYPTIQVQTFYPGASPEVMSSSVTSPLERQFGQIPGLTQMTSSSSGGGSSITLQFSLSESIDVAQQDVQAAINAASSFLPKDLPNPPIYSKVNPADAPILTLALTSDSLPLSKVEDLADTILAQKISQLSGVGLVSIAGGQKPAVRIQANPTALTNYGHLARRHPDRARHGQRRPGEGQPQRPEAGLHDRRQRSAALERRLPERDHRVPQRQPRAAEGCRQRGRLGGEPVPGRVDGQSCRDDWPERRWTEAPARDIELKPAVIVNIQRQPGANIIGVVDEVQKLLPRLHESLPASRGPGGAHRPDQYHSRLREGRPVRAHA